MEFLGKSRVLIKGMPQSCSGQGKLSLPSPGTQFVSVLSCSGWGGWAYVRALILPAGENRH